MATMTTETVSRHPDVAGAERRRSEAIGKQREAEARHRAAQERKDQLSLLEAQRDYDLAADELEQAERDRAAAEAEAIRAYRTALWPEYETAVAEVIEAVLDAAGAHARMMVLWNASRVDGFPILPLLAASWLLPESPNAASAITPWLRTLRSEGVVLPARARAWLGEE